MKAPLLALGLLLCSAAVTSAQTQVVLLTPVADGTIFRNNSSPADLLSSGSGDSFFCGRTQSRGHTTQRALLRFDVSSIPCGATIQSVSLTLTLFAGGTGVSSPTIELHRALASWGEGPSGSGGGSGTTSQAGDSDWYNRLNPNLPWTTAGGDFDEIISASKPVSRTIGPFTWASTQRLIDDVTLWVSNPASNHGWLLRGNEVTGGSTRKFWSRESVDPAVRPVLRVEYEPGAALPVVTAQPLGMTACLARSAAFTVSASGSGVLSYRWQKEAAPVGSGAWSDLSNGSLAGGALASGATTASLSLSKVSPATVARFRCRVTNGCGSTNSDPALLSLCLANADNGTGTGVCDGGVGIEDLLYYLSLYAAGVSLADTDDGSGSGRPDDGVGIEDLLYYLARYDAGC